VLTLHTMRQASEITFQTIRNNTSGRNRVQRVQCEGESGDIHAHERKM
jgi:hypothetical protein